MNRNYKLGDPAWNTYSGISKPMSKSLIISLRESLSDSLISSLKGLPAIVLLIGSLQDSLKDKLDGK